MKTVAFEKATCDFICLIGIPLFNKSNFQKLNQTQPK
jgi:hypothetical protein